MAIRRLNYTGRKKIRREDVSIALTERPNLPATFDVDLKLSEYKLPDDALVSVEARLQTRWMRFGYGSVGAIVPAADRTLTEFDSTDGMVFSVKVTAVSENPGKLLAEADGIPVRFLNQTEERRNPLLPVKSDDIGHEVYRLDFSNDPPILLVNRAAGDKEAIARSPLFMSIVYPAALREILTRIVQIEEVDDPDDDGDSWQARWLKFAVALPGVGPVPAKDDGDREQWIDDVVATFAKQQAMLDRFTAAWQKGGA
ncbi:hypothetical protein AYO40_02625 [Planctomycetaceae bacterium SCGC AG-212-D15]|nr:hypothetical protein AYO40_02625 [Planctomycetaceae bacterium SCGC AG-212-D15]